jgi:hypothetical protein
MRTALETTVDQEVSHDVRSNQTQTLGIMAGQPSADTLLAASIAACDRITSFLTDNMGARNRTLKDVPHLSRYDSLHVVQCAPDEIAILQSS